MPVTLPETIVRRRCAALIPYARNARTHSDQQVAQIAASIRKFGFTNPVLIDDVKTTDEVVGMLDQCQGR
jgi:ParB-like chromosome segregation protein Spo0J